MSSPHCWLTCLQLSFHTSSDGIRPVNAPLSAVKCSTDVSCSGGASDTVMITLAALGKWLEGCRGPWQGSHMQLELGWGWNKCQIPSWHVDFRRGFMGPDSHYFRATYQKKCLRPHHKHLFHRKAVCQTQQTSIMMFREL